MKSPKEIVGAAVFLLFILVSLCSFAVQPVSAKSLMKRASFYIANETVCVVDGVVYYNSDPIPSDDPCETCKCRPPGFACVLRKCEVKPGCKAVRKEGECCPQYVCGCEHNGVVYTDGEVIKNTESPCYTCFCHGSSIACALVDCYFRHDCAPKYVPGECCPRYDDCPPEKTPQPYNVTATRPSTNAPSVVTYTYAPRTASSPLYSASGPQRPDEHVNFNEVPLDQPLVYSDGGVVSVITSVHSEESTEINLIPDQLSTTQNALVEKLLEVTESSLVDKEKESWPTVIEERLTTEKAILLANENPAENKPESVSANLDNNTLPTLDEVESEAASSEKLVPSTTTPTSLIELLLAELSGTEKPSTDSPPTTTDTIKIEEEVVTETSEKIKEPVLNSAELESGSSALSTEDSLLRSTSSANSLLPQSTEVDLLNSSPVDDSHSISIDDSDLSSSTTASVPYTEEIQLSSTTASEFEKQTEKTATTKQPENSSDNIELSEAESLSLLEKELNEYLAPYDNLNDDSVLKPISKPESNDNDNETKLPLESTTPLSANLELEGREAFVEILSKEDKSATTVSPLTENSDRLSSEKEKETTSLASVDSDLSLKGQSVTTEKLDIIQENATKVPEVEVTTQFTPEILAEKELKENEPIKEDSTTQATQENKIVTISDFKVKEVLPDYTVKPDVEPIESSSTALPTSVNYNFDKEITDAKTEPTTETDSTTGANKPIQYSRVGEKEEQSGLVEKGKDSITTDAPLNDGTKSTDSSPNEPLLTESSDYTKQPSTTEKLDSTEALASESELKKSESHNLHHGSSSHSQFAPELSGSYGSLGSENGALPIGYSNDFALDIRSLMALADSSLSGSSPSSVDEDLAKTTPQKELLSEVSTTKEPEMKLEEIDHAVVEDRLLELKKESLSETTILQESTTETLLLDMKRIILKAQDSHLSDSISNEEPEINTEKLVTSPSVENEVSESSTFSSEESKKDDNKTSEIIKYESIQFRAASTDKISESTTFNSVTEENVEQKLTTKASEIENDSKSANALLNEENKNGKLQTSTGSYTKKPDLTTSKTLDDIAYTEAEEIKVRDSHPIYYGEEIKISYSKKSDGKVEEANDEPVVSDKDVSFDQEIIKVNSTENVLNLESSSEKIQDPKATEKPENLVSTVSEDKVADNLKLGAHIPSIRFISSDDDKLRPLLYSQAEADLASTVAKELSSKSPLEVNDKTTFANNQMEQTEITPVGEETKSENAEEVIERKSSTGVDISSQKSTVSVSEEPILVTDKIEYQSSSTEGITTSVNSTFWQRIKATLIDLTTLATNQES